MSGINQVAYKNRGSFKGVITSASSSGYTVTTRGGGVYRGCQAMETWNVEDWVTVVVTDKGYAIIGEAASGPTSYVIPGSGS